MLAALDEMKNNRTAGPGNIPIEWLKYGPKISWQLNILRSIKMIEIMNKWLLVVKPECLYASECIALNFNLDKLEILERRIIR